MVKIWHYTSQEAALNIVSTMKLRLTRQDFLDDCNEFRYYQRVAKKIEKDFPHSSTAHDYADFISTRETLFLNPNRTFIACFSKDGDDVSQWERYADIGRGVALGFDASKLDIREVSYENEERVLQHIKSNLEKYKDDSVGFHNFINPFNEITKQSHYSSEKEVRVCKREKDTKKQLFFSRKDTICPYVHLDIQPNTLIELRLGPRARDNSQFAWRDYLDPNFLSNNAGVYRDWTDRSLDKVTIKISKSDCILHHR